MKLPPLPYKISDAVNKKAINIQLAIFDVDGVLTDGQLHYGNDGEQIKVFNALDGHGLKMLMHCGIEVAVISARNSQPLKTRLKDLGVKHSYLGESNKLQKALALFDELNICAEQCAFIGDDVIDLAVMQRCGLAFSVSNGHFIVQEVADWVSPLAGGNGAVRSICDVLLYSQNNYPLTFTSSQ